MNILVSLHLNYIDKLKVILTSLQIKNPNEELDIYVLNSSLTE